MVNGLIQGLLVAVMKKWVVQSPFLMGYSFHKTNTMVEMVVKDENGLVCGSGVVVKVWLRLSRGEGAAR